MAIPAPIPESSPTPSPGLALPTIPAVPLMAAQLPELIEDFFHWLQDEWQLPVLSQNPAPPPLILPPRPLDDEKYSKRELCQLWGWPRDKVANDLRKFRIPIAGYRLTPSWHRSANVYRGQDLLPVIQQWEWQRLSDQINAHWHRFFQDPCGGCFICKHASRGEVKLWVDCTKNWIRKQYRIYFFSMVKGIQTYGSLSAWWRFEFHVMQSDPSITLPKNSGLILYYLLDRHYLTLSWEEIAIIFPLPGMLWEDLWRPWRLQRPEEYATLVEILADIRDSEKKIPVAILGGLALLLLQFGLRGVTELGRPLSTEEIETAIQQKYLLTSLIYADVYLPYPQSPDIRLGHLLLDKLRMFLWKHSRPLAKGEKRRLRDAWPYPLEVHTINAIEQVLCSHRWYGNRGILVPRPETKGPLLNPYRHQQRVEHEGYALSQLPPFVQEQVNAFICKRYLKDRIALSTLEHDMAAVMRFLHFTQQRNVLEQIESWDRKKCNQLFKAFETEKYKDLTDDRRSRIFASILIWFETLAELEFPVPPGYSVVRTYISHPEKQERHVPPEALLDRVFRDGVCLHPDPYIRLALTIQYFCGTRIQETLDMHFFCMWQDEDDRVYLTIPIGKTKEERLFPIAPLGMEPLVSLIQAIIDSQLRSGHLSQGRVRANYRYLETDLAKASSWYYLFDRFVQKYGMRRSKLVLSPGSVFHGLEVAVRLAAQVDSRGLFVEGTYNPRCQKQVKKGERCGYVAMRAGVTTCPICEGKLKGQRGERCWRRLRTNFVCKEVATGGNWFCPVCDGPLAQLVRITTHMFRHNSVTRASRRGIPLIHNMQLHGHRSLKMHKHYNHPELKELYEKVQDVMEAMYLRNVQMQSLFIPGQIVVDGVAQTPSLEQYFGLTLRRSWRRETSGIWGGFVANMLSDEGIQSPMRGATEIYITEETYAHTVAQYRYDALGLAISEVSLERRTRGKHHAQVPPYLNRRVIEQLVTQHPALNEQLSGNLAIRLIQGEIKRQRARLDELAAILQPWWQHYGSIDQLVMVLTPTDIDPFYQEVSDGA